ncbi:MAG: hypothetical protein IPK67_02780 [Planctomycetes bacterium]|nr:hypothetical protein [Planctomycetota bacterium]
MGFPHEGPLARRRWSWTWIALASWITLLGFSGSTFAQEPGPREACLDCHAGIEEMHPKAPLSCTACHGGDGSATSKERAHVAPRRAEAGDERVAPRDEDPAFRRFQNPMDLRVAEEVCAPCHAEEVTRVHRSLHATTAGHLSDGFYEVGLLKEKGSRYSIFPVTADPSVPGDAPMFEQVPPFNSKLPRDRLATHFMDLTRKECAQCHLWSKGRAVRGRVGFDGDYRGEGCAACHVAYAQDGRSRSADASIDKLEPGHPARHGMTRAPATSTCTACHNGDAAIGLSFQGKAQLPPGAPGGPEIPGTTDVLLHRAFYIDDPAVTPPDVHHERGMHCVDCHTENDAMGDGSLRGAMENAVEIACQDCHGTFTARSTLRTASGTLLTQLSREADGVWLTGKVDGARHRVVQVVDVLAHGSEDHNPRAAEAMNSSHARLECYTCHAGWNPNFLGFHFDRNESLSQLDLLSGKRTQGRVTTQEKLFATWKSFYAGFNESGRIAPYLTGFSTMGTVHDAEGKLLLDQELPVTAAGLSGMTMIHHQLHTTRPTARSCVECHRSGATWGLGSPNFRIFRELAFVADRRGVEIVALDRALLQSSRPLCKVVIPDVVALALDCEPLQGHGRTLFAAEGGHGVHAVDVGDPRKPARVGFAATADPRSLALAGNVLLVADGAGGLKLFDVSKPAEMKLAGQVPTLDARSVFVQWPHAYVADGPGGLLIVDVRDPAAPRVTGGLAMDWKGGADETVDVGVLFQYSRPTVFGGRPADDRTEARALCAVLDAERGLELVDVTRPSAPRKLWPPRYREEEQRRSRLRLPTRWRALSLRSHVDLGQAQGGARTVERDVAYLLNQRDENGNARSRMTIWDVSDPLDARTLSEDILGFDTRGFTTAAVYQPPFLRRLAFASGDRGVHVADASISVEQRGLGVLSGISEARATVFEEFALDRSLDEQGARLKDVSHRNSRWLELREIARVLDVPDAALNFEVQVQEAEVPFATARLHLSRLDLDGSGALEGAEFAAGGGAGADLDHDGRISLAELATLARRAEGESEAGAEGGAMKPEPPAAPGRAGARALPKSLNPDGEQARVLDTVRPETFDGDGDERLALDEFTRALFAALDLNGDKALSLDELSRLPGETRRLRFGGADAAALARTYDKNGDGRVVAREFRGAEALFAELDLDHDTFVQLPQRVDLQKGKQAERRLTEWPLRQRARVPLPPVITREILLARFDADRDGVLTAKELRLRPDLMMHSDRTGDGRIEALELQADLDRIDGDGVEATLDGFLERWDLDRDGKVSPEELPLALRR